MQRLKSIKLTALLLLLATPIIFPATALAATPAEVQKATNVITDITNILIIIAGSLAIVFIIVGAIMYSVSGGDERRIDKGKATIKWAIIGLVIALLAAAIVNAVRFIITSNFGG